MANADGLSIALEQKLLVNDAANSINKKKKKKSKGKSKSISAGLSDDSPMKEGMAHADRALKAGMAENKFNKNKRKDRKTYCGHCGKHKDAGIKLQTCSRCKSINYCSSECQKDHWKINHKADCESFAYPPIAKHFDPGDRNDIPWPIDPVFMKGNSNGLGMWMTACGNLSQGLLQACEPVDHRSQDARDAMLTIDGPGTPAFRRWAGLPGRPIGPELKKYVGPTLLGVRIVLQNRRKDGKDILVYGAQTRISVHEMIKPLLFPEDIKRALVIPRSKDVGDLLSFLPWKDYNNQSRVTLLEINGVDTPQGKLGKDGEWEPPKRPTGDLWNRVKDWDEPSVVLSPGDFAVYRLQYRLGDGDVCQTVPDVITRAFNVGVAATLLSSTPNSQPIPGSGFLLVAPTNFDYVTEYYKPYYEEGSDEFAEQRLGGRATEGNEMLKKVVPLQMKQMFGVMTPADRKIAVESFKSLGMDVEEMIKLAE